jgi:hypothetical protein
MKAGRICSPEINCGSPVISELIPYRRVLLQKTFVTEAEGSLSISKQPTTRLTLGYISPVRNFTIFFNIMLPSMPRSFEQ